MFTMADGQLSRTIGKSGNNPVVICSIDLFNRRAVMTEYASASNGKGSTPGGPNAVVIPHLEMDELDKKVTSLFEGKIVRKDLTSMMKRGANVPTFVLEYLLGMYCSTEDEEVAREGVARITRILDENYVRPDESETVKSKIRELGQYTIIDKVHASLDEYKDIYVAGLSNLALEPFAISPEFVRQYTKILQGGIWCIMRIEYHRPGDDEDALADIFDDGSGSHRGLVDDSPALSLKKRGSKRGPEDSPFRISSLRPIQMPNLDLDAMIDLRKEFSTQEWMDLLLRSCGYEPSALTDRQKLHFIERLVPLVEHNYNLCELGPRGTGKSHVYKEISPYAILLSGGQTTTANLFGRMNARPGASSIMRAGLVGNWDAVTFDEVAGMNFKDMNAIQILKDYMASGSFARGRDSMNADASMVFEGNINDSVQNVLKTTHLFEPFPPEFNNDSAFFDRIHCYLPGWEVPKMRSDLLTDHYGLITDCLSEFCHAMRKKDFSHVLDQYFRFNNDFNKRDEIGVRKNFSGLAKLLFPDGAMSKDDVAWLLEYAIEGRRRVKEQLKIMAGVEFIDVNLGYVDVDNPMSVHVVGVPEQSDGTLIPDSQLLPGHVFAVGRSRSTGEYAVYKLENKAVAGNLEFKTEGIGFNRPVNDAVHAAFRIFKDKGMQVAGGMRINEKDYLLFFNDLQSKGLSDEVSLAEFVGLCSAACGRPVTEGTVIPGALRISGTIDELHGLEDILRVSKNAGARKVLLPMSSIRDLQNVSTDILACVGVDFYPDEDVIACARKALDL